jgi:hypothetical protein
VRSRPTEFERNMRNRILAVMRDGREAALNAGRLHERGRSTQNAQGGALCGTTGKTRKRRKYLSKEAEN